MSIPYRKVLYVDDDVDACEMMVSWLGKDHDDMTVITAHSAGKARELISGTSFDLFILDARLPDETGWDLCRQIRKTDRETPVLIYSGMSDNNDRKIAMDAGADAFLVKPNDLETLSPTVRQLLRRRAVAAAS